LNYARLLKASPDYYQNWLKKLF